MQPHRVHRTWLSSDRILPRRFVRPLLRYMSVEASSGIVLLAAAVAALVWANAPFGETYETFWSNEVAFEAGPLHIEETLRGVVNDGLMVFFFFVVGMEIKRELVVGDLRDPKRAALPAFAAVGGMVLPALLYLAIAEGGQAAQGWGIPMATDIAFSLGVVALLGARISLGAKLFLLALAIVDDIGAIAVIAIFYTEELILPWLLTSLASLLAIMIARRIGIRSMTLYVILGVVAWFGLLESGVHATLAGVALGLLTPARAWYGDDEYRHRATWILSQYEMGSRDPRARERLDHDALALAKVARESVSPLNRIEEALQPWSSFLVVPIFALANAGVRFTDVDLVETATSSVAVAVAVGLVVGKLAGVSIFTWVAVRLGFGRLPRNTTWLHVIGLASLAGIGFTVSLFVTGLAFTDLTITDQAKTGIFIGSTVAGVLGYLLLRTIRAPTGGPAPAESQ